MSDEASCACLVVRYKTFPSVEHPGSVFGQWHCDLCGALFLPKRLAEYQCREARGAALEEAAQAVDYFPTTNIQGARASGVLRALAKEKP